MVTARFKFYPEENRYTMRVSGHARQGPKGFDVVCAGASIFAMTIAQAFINMGKEDRLEEPPHIEIEDGRIRLSVIPKEEFIAETLHTFYFAQLGFGLLEESYPDHAKLISFEAPDKGDLEESSTLRTGNETRPL